MADQLHYFRCTAWYHWLWVFVGVGLETLLIVSPDVFPYASFGPVGSFLEYLAYQQPTLLRIMLVGTVLVHIGEGVYAFILARRMNLVPVDVLLWTAQTTALGFTSLLPLRAKYKQTVGKNDHKTKGHTD